MLQPFERFKPEYIQRLQELKRSHIVTQTYTRGFDHFAEYHPTDLLFTDYDDPGLATTHYNAVKGDIYAYILDLGNGAHVNKIQEMAAGSTYALYWSIVRDTKELKKRIDLKYADRIRTYVTQKTNWKIGGDETIAPSLQVIFGELYMILKRGSQTLRVKFEEIEKM